MPSQSAIEELNASKLELDLAVAKWPVRFNQGTRSLNNEITNQKYVNRMKKTTVLLFVFAAIALNIVANENDCYWAAIASCASVAPPGQPMTSASSGCVAGQFTQNNVTYWDCLLFTYIDPESGEAVTEGPFDGYATQNASAASYTTTDPADNTQGRDTLAYDSLCTFPCQYTDGQGQAQTGTCMVDNIGRPSPNTGTMCPTTGG